MPIEGVQQYVGEISCMLPGLARLFDIATICRDETLLQHP